MRSPKVSDDPGESRDVVSLKLYWEGVGDIVVCTTILHGMAEQHPGKEVRFYLNGGLRTDADKWVEWAKVGWSNSFNSHTTPLAGKVYELGNPDNPDNDPELTGAVKEFRHVLWASMCETKPRAFKYVHSPESRRKARGILKSMGLDLGKPIIYLSPMTNAKERNWPLSRWHRLERELCSGSDVQILIGTSGYHKWATRANFKSFKSPNFLGKHPPDVLIAVMSMMHCIVSNDSGFAHLGGIMGVPTVAVCGGPYRGETVFGWYGGVRVVQAASGNIRSIDVSSVVDAVRELSRNVPGSKLPGPSRPAPRAGGSKPASRRFRA